MSGLEAMIGGGSMMGTFGTILSGVGSLASYASQQKQADYTRAAAQAQQDMLNYQAGQEEAIGQHRAESRLNQGILLASRAQAVSAASGGGLVDNSLIAGILGRAEANAGDEMYTSKSKASNLRYQGEVDVSAANAKASSMEDAAFGSLLGGLGSMSSKLYSQLSPPKPVSRTLL